MFGSNRDIRLKRLESVLEKLFRGIDTDGIVRLSSEQSSSDLPRSRVLTALAFCHGNGNFTGCPPAYELLLVDPDYQNSTSPSMEVHDDLFTWLCCFFPSTQTIQRSQYEPRSLFRFDPFHPSYTSLERVRDDG